MIFLYKRGEYAATEKITETDYRNGGSTALLWCWISRVEETIQRVAGVDYQVEEVEMYVITNGLFVNLHQQEDYTYTRLKYVPSISVNLKKLCDINELSRRIEQENLSIDTAFERLQEIQKAKNEPVWGVGVFSVWVQLRLVISLAEASGIAWQRLCAV